ncbi:hypothetical protein [Oceanobacillus kimchii]|uniref:hypothetical protein n=1 Tax=Oceanobacillus kimchii TaxID=746691 RepID=UPI00232F742D|nr:hypothetical protein [Oceanobacillus kimchii]
MINSKKQYLFSLEERRKLVEDSFKKIKIDTFEGLLTDYMREHNYRGIIKG